MADTITSLEDPVDADLASLVARLHAVRDLVALRCDAERELREAVVAAREAGITWSELAAAFGGTMTRQGISRKYGTLSGGASA